jgi:hypothetical protein
VNQISKQVLLSIPKNYPCSVPILCASHCLDESIDTKQSEDMVSLDMTPNSSKSQENSIIPGDDSERISTPKLKRKLSKTPLSVTEVRRSERVKISQQGFKAKSCKEKTCFCCDVEPPTLSTKVIKSLGKELCKMPDKMISEEKLKKKPC